MYLCRGTHPISTYQPSSAARGPSVRAEHVFDKQAKRRERDYVSRPRPCLHTESGGTPFRQHCFCTIDRDFCAVVAIIFVTPSTSHQHPPNFRAGDWTGKHASKAATRHSYPRQRFLQGFTHSGKKKAYRKKDKVHHPGNKTPTALRFEKIPEKTTQWRRSHSNQLNPVTTAFHF